MRSRSSLIAGIALAAAATLGMSSALATQSLDKGVFSMRFPRGSTLREWLGGGSSLGGRSGRRAGYGWTNAHAQRVAQKRRNTTRARKAQRQRSL